MAAPDLAKSWTGRNLPMLTVVVARAKWGMVRRRTDDAGDPAHA
jgi:hypothetical protein